MAWRLAARVGVNPADEDAAEGGRPKRQMSSEAGVASGTRGGKGGGKARPQQTESVSLVTFLIPGGGEMSTNLEEARAEYHSRVARDGKGHSLGGPGAYVFMTLCQARARDAG
jgi:hypothetical protein